MSRKTNDAFEWSLSDTGFDKLHKLYPQLETDLFASRLNFKLECYVSRRPEPNVCHTDAFSFTWTGQVVYILPLFSLISKILQIIEEDGTEMALLLAPLRPTHS